jgi:hypothetical protein
MLSTDVETKDDKGDAVSDISNPLSAIIWFD